MEDGGTDGTPYDCVLPSETADAVLSLPAHALTTALIPCTHSHRSTRPIPSLSPLHSPHPLALTMALITCMGTLSSLIGRPARAPTCKHQRRSEDQVV